MQPAKSAHKRHSKVRGWWNPPTHAEMLASLKPIIIRGPFSLLWVNPNPNPVDLHPEEDDYDPQEGVED